MVDMSNLWNMQGMMFLMVLTGMIFSKIGVITKEGRSCLTKLTINLFIPCNMVAAFLNADHSMLFQMAEIMLISFVIQIAQYILSKILFRKMNPRERAVMRYSTMVSNAGFLGNPMIQGMYGESGLVLASVFLVPVRLFYWTVGLACYVPVKNKKDVVRQALTHPCIISLFIGLFLMLVPLPLPAFLTKTINSFSTAMTPATMLLIGAILGDVDLKTIVNKTTLYMSFLRLVVIPAAVFAVMLFLPVEQLMAAVTVVLIAMPVATTTAILAERYDGDSELATKVIVLSTILSLITIPVWSMIVEHCF